MKLLPFLSPESDPKLRNIEVKGIVFHRRCTIEAAVTNIGGAVNESFGRTELLPREEVEELDVSKLETPAQKPPEVVDTNTVYNEANVDSLNRLAQSLAVEHTKSPLYDDNGLFIGGN
jgi:hypothetical protein